MSPGVLRPLPVRARAFNGETVTSYARRLADRNGLTVAEIDTWLHRQGLVTSASARHPERLEAYRQLGGLGPTAFTTPTEIDGNWVSERRLCPMCTHGETAWGRLPGVGMICLRHRRWLGRQCRAVHAWRSQVTMERYFRRHLAPRSVFVDSYAMRAGLEYAYLTVDDDLAEQPWNDWDLRLYYRQVSYAAALSDPEFLDVVADPRVDNDRRRDAIQTAARIPELPPFPTWRVENRLWALTGRLRRAVADAVSCGMPVIDTEYNLLRLSSFSSWS